MTKVEIFDKAMCCSTGICGPEVDPVLPRFAADLQWLESQGVSVNRHNLAQSPQAFTENEVVKGLLASEGVECLPLVLVDGRVVSKTEYPSRERFAEWTGVAMPKSFGLPVAGRMPVAGPMPIAGQMPVISQASAAGDSQTDDGGCCGQSGCC
jgi:hypothetical protein